MGILKLFSQVAKGASFFFGDKPDRILIKDDDAHYVAPEGRHVINRNVAVMETKSKPNGGTRSITTEERD